MESKIFVNDVTGTEAKTHEVQVLEVPEVAEPPVDTKGKTAKKISVVCTQCGTRVIVGPGLPSVSESCPFCGGGKFVTYKRPTK